jgi:tetratricopeptide (TPR) repeat protein
MILKAGAQDSWSIAKIIVTISICCSIASGRGISASAEPFDSLSQRAIGDYNAGRFKEAYPLFISMVKRDNNDLRAKYYLGLTCQKLGQVHNAIQMYVQIVSLAPDSPEGKYSKVALNILAHRKTVVALPVPGKASDLSDGGLSRGSVISPPLKGASTAPNVSAVSTDLDMLAAQKQAAEIMAGAKRQADELDAKAEAIEKDMASVMKPKGNQPAYSPADIAAETADMRKQSAAIRERAQRESDDTLNRAKLRLESSSHHQ